MTKATFLRCQITFAILAVMGSSIPLHCQTTLFPLNQKATKTLVDSLAAQITRFYVLEPEALKMSANLKKKFKGGRYDNVADPHQLAALLTEDVNSVYRDEHFHVEYNPVLASEISGNVEDVPKMVAEKLEIERTRNFGFKKAENLNGNIGYLEISSFSRLNQYSRATADAALGMLSNSEALIIDLRYGIGGSPDMVNHILGKLFSKRTHYSDIYIRSENISLPYWTTPDSVPGRLTEIPIYILTSYKTFSAAEGLAYALQSLKRATVVGEITRGGAHTVTYRPLSSGFITDLPFGKAQDPVTKKNWEGTGIIPDVKVNADASLEAAEEMIFKKYFSSARDSGGIRKIAWQHELIRSRNHPLIADSASLVHLTGKYGAYELTYHEGSIYYQKTGKAKFRLIPMSPDKFRPQGNDSFMVEIKKSGGNITGITTLYEDGRIEQAARNIH